MSASSFATALGRRLEPTEGSGNDSCWQRTMVGLRGVSLMVLGRADSAVVRVDITDPEIRTSSGVGVGSTEVQVERAFPGLVEVQPHKYEPNGHYLIVHSGPHDLLFETNAGKTVTTYRFGNKEPVGYVEGCL
jgi:hypothetical protein